VKGARDVTVRDPAFAQGGAPVGAAVAQTMDLSLSVTPKDQFFPHTGDAYGLMLDLAGLEHDVPLVANH
jgi:hypothetical protein